MHEGTLLAYHLGRLKDEKGLAPEQVGVGKLNNTREALEMTRTSRGILGANGITLEYPIMRHMTNLESVIIYEGTQEVHSLVIRVQLTASGRSPKRAASRAERRRSRGRRSAMVRLTGAPTRLMLETPGGWRPAIAGRAKPR